MVSSAGGWCRAVLVVLAWAAGASAARGEEPEATQVLVATGDDVYLRAGPSVDHHDLGTVAAGDLLVLAGSDGDWRRVCVPGGLVGYVHATLVDWEEGDLEGAVRVDDVLVRATPAKDYFPLEGQRLGRGDAVVVLERVAGEDGDWLRVVCPQRLHAWIHGRYVRSAGEVAQREEDLRKAAERRLDELSGGRTRRLREERRNAFLVRLRGFESALSQGRAGLAELRSARAAVIEAPDAALRKEAERIVRELEAAVEDPAPAPTPKAEPDADAAPAPPPAPVVPAPRRGAPSRASLEAEGRLHVAADGTATLEAEGRPALRLSGRRYRLGDYAGLRVRVTGQRRERPGETTELEVQRLEVLGR